MLMFGDSNLVVLVYLVTQDRYPPVDTYVLALNKPVSLTSATNALQEEIAVDADRILDNRRRHKRLVYHKKAIYKAIFHHFSLVLL